MPPETVKAMVADTDTRSLAGLLAGHTRPARLCRQEGDKIRCLACAHRCLLAEGRHGICRVRFNRNGELRAPFGYVAGVASDPVEKKPFYHVLPGTDALTFGMLGCDLHCGYCQNWITSQALRDPAASASIQEMTPSRLVRAAQASGARLMVSSYNEPLITAEWAAAVFEEAAAAGLLCAFVSNGNATAEALDFLKPWLCAYKIDLKSFNDRRYRTLGTSLEHVLEGIRMVHARGLWLEVVTLLVPGFNDDDAELRAMAGFLAGVSPDIPWHITAFHPQYQMTTPLPTTTRHLARAAAIGAEAGLRYIYLGNAAGRVGEWENTRCPQCGTTLIERTGYMLRDFRITPEGRCPECATPIPGIWHPGGKHEVPSPTGHPRASRRVFPQ